MNKLIKSAILSLGLLASCKQAVPFEEMDYSNVEFDIPKIEYQEEMFGRNLNDLEKVLMFVRFNTAYTSDEVQYGQRDYWATPDKTFNSHHGDCEDYVILDMYLLKRDLGIDSSMVTGINKTTGTGHAWLEVDGKTYEAQYGKEKSFDNYSPLNKYSYSEVMEMITTRNKSLEVID